MADTAQQTTTVSEVSDFNLPQLGLIKFIVEN